MFDVRLVHAFVAVARFRHFGRAAEALNATQPGVSQHIAKLEQQLGAELLARTRRSVELTPAGETFLVHAQSLLQLLQRMENDTQRVAAGLMGKLVLGLSSSIIYSDVPTKIAQFSRDNPTLQLGFEVRGAPELLAMLDSGEIDAILTTLPISGSKYARVQISEQPMAVALPAGHPLAGRAVVTLEDVRGEPFIQVPREQHPANYDALVTRFREMGAELRISAYETTFPNVLARVAVGEGLGLVALGYKSEPAGSVQVVALDDPLLSVTPIYAVTHIDYSTEGVKQLVTSLAVAPS